MPQTNMHIQAVLYETDFDALARSCESFANALRQASKAGISFDHTTFSYGDASPTPTLSDAQVAHLTELFKDIAEFSYTFFDENTGFGGGHNRLSQTQSDGWLLIINPDIVVGPSFFGAMLGSCSPTNNSAETTTPHAPVGIVEARQSPIDHPKDFDIETGDTSWASGACMMIDAALFARLSGFDTEAFYMYCEDVDLSWRVRLEGYRVVHQSAAIAYHPKRLGPQARWQSSEWEVRHSALSNLMMAYKWSNDERLHALIDHYAAGNEPAQHAALEQFEQRRAAGTLPSRLDPEQTIATFIDGEYAHHRFTL